MSNRQTITFQEALGLIESLPDYQQDDLIEIVRRRRIEQRREQIAKDIKTARHEYAKGNVTYGTVDELMKELTE